MRWWRWQDDLNCNSPIKQTEIHLCVCVALCQRVNVCNGRILIERVKKKSMPTGWCRWHMCNCISFISIAIHKYVFLFVVAVCLFLTCESNIFDLSLIRVMLMLLMLLLMPHHFWWRVYAQAFVVARTIFALYF